LIDRAPTDDDLRSHRLQVLAARRFRTVGRAVPPDFVAAERGAAISSMTTRFLLERIAAAYGESCIVLKGPEVAARYPLPERRGYGDLDLLVRDAEGAQRALLDAGFEPVGDPSLFLGIHHLRPLVAPGLPLAVEIHSAPKWIDHGHPPTTEELFRVAVPGCAGVPGVFGLPPEEHAVLLAAHAWAHEPLRTLGDLVDVAATVAAADRERAAAVAAAWGVRHLWRTTIAASDAVLADGRVPWALRTWARNLPRVRERTVLESHLARLLSDFHGLPLPTALARIPSRLGDELLPSPDERWSRKAARSARAVRNRSRPRSQHERQLGETKEEPSPPSTMETVSTRSSTRENHQSGGESTTAAE